MTVYKSCQAVLAKRKFTEFSPLRRNILANHSYRRGNLPKQCPRFGGSHVITLPTHAPRLQGNFPHKIVSHVKSNVLGVIANITDNFRRSLLTLPSIILLLRPFRATCGRIRENTLAAGTARNHHKKKPCSGCCRVNRL